MAGFDLTRISLHRPVILWVFFGIIVLAGIFSYSKLNYELVPRFNPPVLTVVTIYPGAPATEVEKEVSLPIENALSGLQGLETMTTTSQDNFSLVRLEMRSGVDVESVLNDANRKLLAAVAQLPDNAQRPVLSRFDFDDLPMMRLSVSGALTSIQLSQWVEDQVIPRLSQVEGVAEVVSYGAIQKVVSVEVLPERLDLTHTSILQVLQALGKNSVQIPAGDLKSAHAQQPTLFKAYTQSISELEELVIFENKEYGLKVKLKDVAHVAIEEQQPTTINRLNGEQAIGLEIKKQPDANAVNLSERIRAEIDTIEEDWALSNLMIEVAQDTSVFTLHAAESVTEDLILAIVLVSLVMLLFLHSLRNALIVFFSIPICILTTFLVMVFLGYSLNLLSLLGLSLAIGILVDDSIVVIENIYRYLLKGDKPMEAAYTGRMEIGKAAISITLIDVVVFLPLVFSSGMVADLLREFAVVIVVSTMMSLLVSFTLVPHLAARFHHKFSKPKTYSFFQQIDRILEGLTHRVVSLLRWSLSHKWAVILVILSLIASTSALFVFGLIGVEFTKAGDRSEFILELAYDKGTSLHEASQSSKKVEAILMGYPAVKSVLTKVGSGSRGRITINDPSLAEVYVKLVDKSERDYSSAQFARHIKYRLMEEVPGLEVRPIDINIIGLRDDDAVLVTLLSEEDSTLRKSTYRLKELLEETQGAVEVQHSLESGLSTVVADPIRTRMEYFSMDPARVGMTLRTALEGHKDFKFIQDDVILPIDISLKDDRVQDIRDLKALTVLNDGGQMVPLSSLVRFREEALLNRLERTNRSRSATVQSQVYGKAAGSVSRSFQTRVEEEALPTSVTLQYGGATKRTRDGILSMLTALIISVVLVYAVLVVLYNSFGVPLVVLVSLPLATIGAFLLLALTGEALSIFSIMGLIILAGLVGKNAILVVDVARKRMQEGLAVGESLIEATKLRLRPILMTNLTMIIGLLPIALSSGAGAEWKNGLAWALIGGLSSSMLLSLIVVPILYDLGLRMKRRWVG